MTSRVDPQPSFDWGLDSPFPAVGVDDFLVRWTGTIKVPTTDTYFLGGTYDDGAKITVNGSTVLDDWQDTEPASAPTYGTSVVLTAGIRYPITVEFAEGAGAAGFTLWVKDDNGDLPEAIAPSSWFRPGSVADDTLPGGWSLAAPGATYGIYRKADIGNDSVVLETFDGGVVEFTRTEEGGWLPPTGSTATLAVDTDGRLTLHDGMVYVFRSDGLLDSVRSPADTVGSPAPTYSWVTLTDAGTDYLRLDEITDPVSGRSVELVWKTSTQSCSGANQPAFGTLCEIDWWDGTSTTLQYNSAGNLAKITNPGSQRWEFAYNGSGLLKEIVEPLALDAKTAGVRTDSSTINWKADYWSTTTFDPPRAKKLESPRPASDTDPRMVREYTYSNGATEVEVSGLVMVNGYARRVAFDTEGRPLTDTDALGHTTTTAWDAAHERVRYVDDPAGLRTATVYDGRGYPTDTYGPAPSSWFGSDDKPTSGHVVQTPRAQTGYDEDWENLAATWWANDDLSGQPSADTLGVTETASGAIDKNWGSGAPSGLGVTDHWSGRLTGLIDLDSGSYGFQVERDGQARVWIDGELIVDAWEDGTGTVSGLTEDYPEAAQHQISVEYADPGGTASVKLSWDEPGGGSTYTTVPAAAFSSDYGLATSTTDPDGKTTATTYPTPWEGLASGTVVDPGGLALTTSMAYETASSTTYRRPTSRTLPAGNTWTYTYYGSTETRDNPCTVTADPANQAGLQKARTGPAPVLGSAIAEEVVYDVAGRPVATRIGTEDWSCVTYDGAGRPLQRTTPAFGGEAGRSITWDYDVGANPLIVSVTDGSGTITTTLDLLGRPVENVDVWAKTTTVTYDQAGRAIETSGPEGTVETAVNDLGQTTSVALDGETVAEVTYDSAGRPSSYTYPGGTGDGGNGTSSDTLGYDSLGRAASLVWNQPGGTDITSDTRTYSLAGRVSDQSIDGADANPSGANFTYDAAGRLTAASTAVTTFAYAFAPSGGCGANDDAGKNTNRTSMTVGTATYTYCYDNADRLTSYTPPGSSAVTPTYDAHGNTTAIDTQTATYDADNRNLSIANGTTTVRYTRDALDQIVERKENGVTTARYSGAAQLDTSGNVIERTIPLPGGVIVTKRSTGEVWSYPNLRGEIVATASEAGLKQGSTVHYGPYGESSATPDNAPGDYDIGWTGQRHTEHATGLTPLVQMGARVYAPILGRFTEVDPVEGGSASDYEYGRGDPVNLQDWSGTRVSISDFGLLMRLPGIHFSLSTRVVFHKSWLSWFELCAGLCYKRIGTNHRMRVHFKIVGGDLWAAVFLQEAQQVYRWWLCPQYLMVAIANCDEFGRDSHSGWMVDWGSLASQIFYYRGKKSISRFDWLASVYRAIY